jgi:hypothetical protein
MEDSIFSIVELKNEILNIRRNTMMIGAYKKYLLNRPDTFYYNQKENIYIRKLDENDHIYFIYDVIPEQQCLILRRGYYHKYK